MLDLSDSKVVGGRWSVGVSESRRGQFNFVWIFAIFAGGAILALAIYGAVQTGDMMRFGSDTEAGKSISILTDPMQAGFAAKRLTFRGLFTRNTPRPVLPWFRTHP